MPIDELLLSIGPNDPGHVRSLTDVGAEIAGPTGARLHLVYVFSETGYEELLAEDPGLAEGAAPDMVAESIQRLGTAADRLADLGIDCEIHGAVSDAPADAVGRLIEDLDVDMVLIGGESRSPAGKALFGDHAQQILLQAPCPVTFVKRNES
jgi:nucleotide-binding universal stress UspA family protein